MLSYAHRIKFELSEHQVISISTEGFKEKQIQLVNYSTK